MDTTILVAGLAASSLLHFILLHSTSLSLIIPGKATGIIRVAFQSKFRETMVRKTGKIERKLFFVYPLKTGNNLGDGC